MKLSLSTLLVAGLAVVGYAMLTKPAAASPTQPPQPQPFPLPFPVPPTPVPVPVPPQQPTVRVGDSVVVSVAALPGLALVPPVPLPTGAAIDAVRVLVASLSTIQGFAGPVVTLQGSVTAYHFTGPGIDGWVELTPAIPSPPFPLQVVSSVLLRTT